jgi:2-oxoisovalerate dehydrogenase E2 component (dihydrolipoyl transacylase)
VHPLESAILGQFALPRVTQQRFVRLSHPVFGVETFKLADIGEGIAEVTVTEWFVKEGQMIKEMDNVCAVESDKASVELTSPYTGKVLKLHAKTQDVVKVGSPLIEVEVATAGTMAKATAAAAPAASVPAVPPAAEETRTFKLADIGEGIAEVIVTEWFVKEGDTVKEMDNLCAVESDKASVELTSPYTGTVSKVYAKASDTVKVGSALVDIKLTGSSAVSSTASAVIASVATASSVKEFKLSDIGEGIAEVVLTEWFVKEGDQIKEMDNLCGVESDKASVELTSPFTGTVKKLSHTTGATVKVGQTLVEIEVAEQKPAALAPTASSATMASAAMVAPTITPASPRQVGSRAPGVLATPIVRALAAEKGVDLKQVTGTGAMGRVLKQDVFAAAVGQVAAVPSEPSTPEVKTPMPLLYRPAVRSLQDVTVEITDGVGKGMVKSMTDALKMPYMALGEEIDVTDLVSLQKALKPIAEKQYGSKVSMTAFFLKAISLSLYEHPIINSKFKDGTPASYTKYGSHNISVAIDSKNGLMVPNIKDVGNMSVLEIQQDVLRLAAAAQANKLALSDITGGTITFSNVGTIGTKDPRPIPFDGQAVIGAAGRVMVLPRYNSNMELVPRQIMNVRWVGDHRHLDGATLARFSNSFKRYIENPGEWTLTLK